MVLASLCCAPINRFSFSWRFLFLSHVQDFSCEISLVSHLKYLYIFSSHFCFLVIVVLLMLVFFIKEVIKISLLFFYIVFSSLYRCINAIFNVCKSSSSFFLDTFCLRHFWIVLPYAFAWVFLFSASFVEVLKEWSRVSYKGDSPGFYPFHEISVWSWVVFSFS